MDNISIKEFIEGMPKAELHLHIEGTFEPELMFEIGKRNNVKLNYTRIEDLKNAYRFNNLQEFLDIYYDGTNMLIKEQDFYDLTWAYLTKGHEQNLIHTEIFFDPQTHTERGVPFETVCTGICRALEDGKKKLGISNKLIMSFVRHLDEASAFRTLEEALPFKKYIDGVGLDSSELGNPPSKFERVFAKAREEGFSAVAHAGEEGPSEYIWEAINLLNVSRIDHGNNSLEDINLVELLAERQIPLTLCPISNLKLMVMKDLRDYPIIEMMSKGLLVTINSDDPAYFGGYINENYISIAEALNLTKEQIIILGKNSFRASWLTDLQKQEKIELVDQYFKNNQYEKASLIPSNSTLKDSNETHE